MAEQTNEKDVSLWQRMSDHDSNEERRYLTDTRRSVMAAWSWTWLSWGFGVWVDLSRAPETNLTLTLGPLNVEVFRDHRFPPAATETGDEFKRGYDACLRAVGDGNQRVLVIPTALTPEESA